MELIELHLKEKLIWIKEILKESSRAGKEVQRSEKLSGVSPPDVPNKADLDEADYQIKQDYITQFFIFHVDLKSSSDMICALRFSFSGTHEFW